MAWLLLGVKPCMSIAAVTSVVVGSQLNTAVPVGVPSSCTADGELFEADVTGGLVDVAVDDVEEDEQAAAASTPTAALHMIAPRSIGIIPLIG
ncbi:hypothetical protein [Nocardia sp.]|uniref:hypothetical protein n=1 Tax=Nocardia sp. TaxID=1821 RepID=UPI002614DF8C|nr:hypothetical protein [Nocardia sp.]